MYIDKNNDSSFKKDSGFVDECKEMDYLDDILGTDEDRTGVWERNKKVWGITPTLVLPVWAIGNPTGTLPCARDAVLESAIDAVWDDIREKVGMALDVRNAFIDRAGDTEWTIRFAAVDALKAYKDEQTAEVLINAVDDESEDVRLAAVGALCGRPGLEITNVLIEKASFGTEKSALVRCAAVALLAERPDSARSRDVTCALVSILAEDSDAGVRLEAVKGLVKRSGADVTRVLINACADSDCAVQKVAVRSMHKRDDGEVVAEAVKCLSYGLNDDVRRAAVVILKKRNGEGIKEALINATWSSNPNIRRDAVYGLAGRQGNEVVMALIRCSRDNDKDVRQAAVYVMDDMRKTMLPGND